MIAQLLLLALCCAGSLVSAGRTCNSVQVPPCQVRAARDLMFLVDASDSMDPLRFNGEMLDYVQSLYCSFNQADDNRAGLITFGKDILVRIPLDRYSQNNWFAQVDALRTQNLCCACCTPTATAFQVAREVFNSIPIGNAFRIVFMITDGAPWQNENGPFSWPATPSATYTWQTVPNQANLIRSLHQDQTRHRIMMVGVPNKFGEPPREDYFRGIPDPTKRPDGKAATWQCQVRNGRTTCSQMLNPPFPIVSTPLDKNIFSSQNYDVQELINLTVGSLCEILPTPSPTSPPVVTKSPTTAAPTLAPTNAPTKQPTAGPSVSPSQAPIRPELDGLDLFLILDRSRSMRWVPDLCRSAPGGNPRADDTVACWQLFLNFVRSIVNKAVDIPYQQTKLGWKDDSPSNIRRGVRVWLYGFACEGHQSVPLTYKIGEKISNAADFEEAMQKSSEMIPAGGTCPGETVERTVAMVQGNELLTRIFKSAILISDGVFYDMPRPARAVRGLEHFSVLTYALGIAIPENGNKYGLSPAEIVLQRQQLMNFVSGDDSRLFNFGLEGLNLLDSIAQQLVDQLPHDALNNLPKVAAEPFWCGWTSKSRCTQKNPDKIATGDYCWWNENSRRCFANNWCGYPTKLKCKKNKLCTWVKNKCAKKD